MGSQNILYVDEFTMVANVHKVHKVDVNIIITILLPTVWNNENL